MIYLADSPVLNSHVKGFHTYCRWIRLQKKTCMTCMASFYAETAVLFTIFPVGSFEGEQVITTSERFSSWCPPTRLGERHPQFPQRRQEEGIQRTLTSPYLYLRNNRGPTKHTANRRSSSLVVCFRSRKYGTSRINRPTEATRCPRYKILKYSSSVSSFLNLLSTDAVALADSRH